MRTTTDTTRGGRGWRARRGPTFYLLLAAVGTISIPTAALGDSPTITPGTNMGFGGIVQVELGGTEPGSGDDNHDQINDSGMTLLLDLPTLEILPWNNFVPELGDEFVIMTWQVGLDGMFGDVVTDPWFTDRDIGFELLYDNPGGAGDLTLRAIPEPATLSLLVAGAIGLAVRRRRRPERERAALGRPCRK